MKRERERERERRRERERVIKKQIDIKKKID